MKWEIQKICPQEEPVFLLKSSGEIVRQVSVPRAADAFIKNGKAIIRAPTGFFCEVAPESGARRRIFGQQPLL